MLGISGDDMPRFARRYADISSEMKRAVASFMKDVRAGAFPGKEHSF